MPHGSSRTPVSQLHGVVYASKNHNEDTEGRPTTGTSPSVSRIGRATPVVPAESPRAYKTIGPTSQHRPKVSTVTMVVLRNPLMMKSFGCA